MPDCFHGMETFSGITVAQGDIQRKMHIAGKLEFFKKPGKFMDLGSVGKASFIGAVEKKQLDFIQIRPEPGDIGGIHVGVDKAGGAYFKRKKPFEGFCQARISHFICPFRCHSEETDNIVDQLAQCF
jgi:hypothetical protein